MVIHLIQIILYIWKVRNSHYFWYLDLPSLHTLHLDNSGLKYISHVVLTNVPACDDLSLTEESLSYVESLTATSWHECKVWLIDADSLRLALTQCIRPSFAHTFVSSLPSLLSDVITMLSLPSNSFNHPSFTSFSLSSLSHIKYFSVGANSFSHVSSWELSDLPSLRQLIVSSRVCAEEEGRFAVTNCDTLASIHIEDESFTLFSECTLQNLPMLQELSIGADDTREACFARVEKVVLDSLPSLHTLQIYCNAFPNARKYRLHSTCVWVEWVIRSPISRDCATTANREWRVWRSIMFVSTE